MSSTINPGKYYSEQCHDLFSAGSRKRSLCERYVDQCIDQRVNGGKNPNESTFTLASANGATKTDMDFYECVQTASAQVSQGNPAGAARVAAGKKDPSGKSTSKKNPPENIRGGSKLKGLIGDPNRFTCDELVGPDMGIIDEFISSANDGKTCYYEKFEGRGAGLVRYSGKGSKCRRIKRFDVSMKQTVEKYKKEICSLMKKFVKRAAKPHKADGHPCSFSYNADRVRGRNKYVCAPFIESVELGGEKRAMMMAIDKKKSAYIRSNLTRSKSRMGRKSF